jgi:dolichol-phosphate mannosyltransferase
MGDTIRSFGLQVHWLGFNTGYVDVPHRTRMEGKSTYSTLKLLQLAADAIISYSNRPLRISIALGLTICIFTVIISLVVLYQWAMSDIGVDGWTSLILSIWFIGGAILANLGLLGIYLGKTYTETKRRPAFVIARTVGSQGQSARQPNVPRDEPAIE